MSAPHYEPTDHDLMVEHLGAELGKLSAQDRICALFCCSYVDELDEIATYLADYVSWERTNPYKAERRQRVIDEMLPAAQRQ